MYSVFEMLCEKNGVTPYKVGKETKIATTTLPDWREKYLSLDRKNKRAFFQGLIQKIEMNTDKSIKAIHFK